ncbi:hypothetical protein AYI70_g9404 [Smittium culicis]|uniref:Uncharacterized protein n=1 Tax=Smittium culicis TaxID=133412 RepID=A0A1R1XBF6_9FUNG|nr:hypothetical protein AYI70_g9404 [Smittium culicis]
MSRVGTFLSGTVVSLGTSYACASYFNHETNYIRYKIDSSRKSLINSAYGNDDSSKLSRHDNAFIQPVQNSILIDKIEQISDAYEHRFKGYILPLAQCEWNSRISNAFNTISDYGNIVFDEIRQI